MKQEKDTIEYPFWISAGWCNGSTPGFEPGNSGSTPGPAAKQFNSPPARPACRQAGGFFIRHSNSMSFPPSPVIPALSCLDVTAGGNQVPQGCQL